MPSKPAKNTMRGSLLRLIASACITSSLGNGVYASMSRSPSLRRSSIACARSRSDSNSATSPPSDTLRLPRDLALHLLELSHRDERDQAQEDEEEEEEEAARADEERGVDRARNVEVDA